MSSTIDVFLGSTYQNAQKMYAIYKQFDKNGDGKITVEDIQIYLRELGLGFVSPCRYLQLITLDFYFSYLFRFSGRIISSSRSKS